MKIMFPIFFFLWVLMLGGCDNAGKNDQVDLNQPVIVSGIVTEHDVPVTQGTILVKDAQGKVVGNTDLNNSANYSVSIPPSVNYPLIFEIKVDDSVLEAVIMDPMSIQHDISTMSTLIVQSARDAGGFTKQNMARAAINAIRQNKKSGGKGTSTGFKGDPTKQYGGWH